MPQFSIVALGDSFTYGYPFGHKYSWVQKLSQSLGIPIANEGINGNTIHQMFGRILVDVVDYDPSYVLFLGGVNDVFHGVSVADMERHFKCTIDFLSKNKIKTILCLPPPLKEPQYEKPLNLFRRFIKKYAKKKNLPIIDFHGPFLDKSKKRVLPSLIEDGIHPSVDGYNRMAEEALPVLQKVLKNLSIKRV